MELELELLLEELELDILLELRLDSELQLELIDEAEDIELS